MTSLAFILGFCLWLLAMEPVAAPKRGRYRRYGRNADGDIAGDLLCPRLLRGGKTPLYETRRVNILSKGTFQVPFFVCVSITILMILNIFIAAVPIHIISIVIWFSS
jgi:hypothetical protein